MLRDSREAQVALELHEDGLTLCYGSLVRVILSTNAALEAANDAAVAENVQSASMIVRKSLVERVMYCWGGAEVLGLAISDRAVGMGAEGSGGAEGVGA